MYTATYVHLYDKMDINISMIWQFIYLLNYYYYYFKQWFFCLLIWYLYIITLVYVYLLGSKEIGIVSFVIGI